MIDSIKVHKKLQELCHHFRLNRKEHCTFSMSNLAKELHVTKETVLAHIEVLKALGFLTADGDNVTITESGLRANLEITPHKRRH